MFKVNFLFLMTGSLFSLLAAQSINIDLLCSLAPNTTILQPNSCTEWLKCPSTIGATDVEKGSCVVGMYFNKNTGKCDNKENVQCPFEISTKNRCSSATEGSFLVDENNCRGYIYCQNGVEIKSVCPQNLVFDPDNKACVYQHQYKCPLGINKNDSNPLCLSLPDNMFFAHQDDCSKYSQCQKGVLSTHSCNKNFAWDYVEGNCVPLEEAVCLPTAQKPEPELKVCVDRVGPVPDDHSCSGYYFCRQMSNDTHDRKPEHFTCAAGTFFDSNTLSCRNRLNVKCSLDRCEGMGNKYVNVAGDCSSYVLCQNGVAGVRNSCPKDHYFDERTQGCTPQVVSFAACAP